jgi:hypothetical protein
METAAFYTSEEVSSPQTALLSQRTAQPELIQDYGDLRENCPVAGWKPDYAISASSRTDQSIDLFLGSKQSVRPLRSFID